ncbi:MAG: two-component system response regulator HydG [Polyangiales bacterium]|jgi:two-component system response regulator HydG
MRVADLNTHELLEIDPEGGVILFAGQRALLIDAVAMGMLRKYLVDNFGFTAARVVLTQFGFAQGWRMADAIEEQFEWSTPDEWRRAGPRMNTLEGLFRLAPGGEDALSKAGAVLVESYEADQHLLHFGRSDACACWTISGLMSGYLSRTQNAEIYVLEDKCIARGDAACHHKARSRDKWGDDQAEALRYFESSTLKESLDVSLEGVAEALKTMEKEVLARRARTSPEEIEEPLGLVAKSPAMRVAVNMAKRVAGVDSTILITGESGAGKERIARLVHAESTRSAGAFIAVNCGAIAESLLESELFGHRRGAFTGASHDRPGLFEAANHGTLLLDELGDVSPGMQVKLLRVLQEREVRRVGDNVTRNVDVRVLAATHHDLIQRVKDGHFREDLYYRINVVEIHVPPLRERRDDILGLARVLLEEAANRVKRKIDGLSPGVAGQLVQYTWPGNVRELANAMEHAAVLARGSRIEVEDLPEEVRNAVVVKSVMANGKIRRLDEMEKEHILAAMELNDGNQAATAEALGIGSATLYRRLKGYGLIADRAPR